MRHLVLILLGAGLFACSQGPADGAGSAGAAKGGALRIGVTLHPYHSWTRNIAGDLPLVEVRPVLPGEVDAGNYQPSADDIRNLADLDALVVNGIGHDDFIGDMLRSSGNAHCATIEPNDETPLIRSLHGDSPNSHTFLSFTNAIQQTYFIARKLGELRPEHSQVFQSNAAAYADRLRAIKAGAAAQLASAAIKRVVTVHDGYGYLLQEFGIELAGVVEPAHGLVPSAKELGEMIELVRKEEIRVVFSEESFPEKLVATLTEATGAKIYVLSHIAVGAYSAEEFERGMQANAEVLVQALVTDPSSR